MATNLLTIGTSETPSSPQTLASDERATLIYKGSPGGVIYVERQDDLGTWESFRTLNIMNRPMVIDGAVTFRVRRAPGTVSCGVSLG